MCGICGKASFTGRPVPRDVISRMNAQLLHRGPDEEGELVAADAGLALAMRRLKVIDLATGSQPVYNEARDVAVMLNGEIYNYLELRSELEALGHRFSTRSDTETIAHAYETWGLECLERLNGMFAFALWDMKRKLLAVARDRMGIKPVYYRSGPEGLAFASEIKSLLQDPDCRREIDLAALDDYFSLLYVPGPRSIFRSIRKLEPGHVLVCDLEKKTVEDRAYWRREVPQRVDDLGWEHYRARLDALFRDALKLQLRADVPNGLFLSSGLDSGVIAYYASQVSSQRLRSFTIHFDEASYSEREGARRIALACGTEHEEILLEPKAEEIISRTADFFDEPFADNSAIPTFLLCQSARRKITVALSGEGGDELFGGYPTYIATRWAQRYRKIPAALRRAAAGAVRSLPVSWERLSLEFKLKQFVYGAEAPAERSHFLWKEIFSEADKRVLYSPEFLSARDGRDSFESFARFFREAGGGVDLEKLLYVDQNTYLADQFLVKSDRMSMAHALEVRVPILDHRIVEFAAQMPERYKIRGWTTKWALRKLLEGKLPNEIVRGSKKGFSPPIPSWIAGELKPFIQSVLSEGSIRRTGLLSPQAVRRLLEEHFSKRRDHHRRIWTILNFVLWHRRWS